MPTRLPRACSTCPSCFTSTSTTPPTPPSCPCSHTVRRALPCPSRLLPPSPLLLLAPLPSRVENFVCSHSCGSAHAHRTPCCFWDSCARAHGHRAGPPVLAPAQAARDQPLRPALLPRLHARSPPHFLPSPPPSFLNIPSCLPPLSQYRRLIGAGAFGSVFECTATSARASARLTVRRPLCAHAETAVAVCSLPSYLEGWVGTE